VHAHNKEGKSLSRSPAVSPVSDIALRSPIAQQPSAGILTCFSVASEIVPGSTGSAREGHPVPTSSLSGLPRFPVTLRFRLTPNQLLLLRHPPPLRPSECCIRIPATTTTIGCPDRSTGRYQPASTRSGVSALLVYSMIAQADLLARFIRDSVQYGYTG
jgi:hypothetical protein